MGTLHDCRNLRWIHHLLDFLQGGLMMLQAGNFMSLMAYVAISVIAGIALVAAGYYLVRL